MLSWTIPKENNGPHFSSITKMFMDLCKCDKRENGYWKLDCCSGNCSNCKNLKLPVIPKKMEKVNYYVFESITRERKSQKTKEKIKTTQTE